MNSFTGSEDLISLRHTGKPGSSARSLIEDLPTEAVLRIPSTVDLGRPFSKEILEEHFLCSLNTKVGKIS